MEHALGLCTNKDIFGRMPVCTFQGIVLNTINTHNLVQPKHNYFFIWLTQIQLWKSQVGKFFKSSTCWMSNFIVEWAQLSRKPSTIHQYNYIKQARGIYTYKHRLQNTTLVSHLSATYKLFFFVGASNQPIADILYPAKETHDKSSCGGTEQTPCCTSESAETMRYCWTSITLLSWWKSVNRKEPRVHYFININTLTITCK